jgi:hypothetical protein
MLLLQVKHGPEKVGCMINELFVGTLLQIVQRHQVTIHDAAELRQVITAMFHNMEIRAREILPNFILPAASMINPPSPHALCDDLFSDFISPFNLAVQNLENTVASLTSLLEKAPRCDGGGYHLITFH